MAVLHPSQIGQRFTRSSSVQWFRLPSRPGERPPHPVVRLDQCHTSRLDTKSLIGTGSHPSSTWDISITSTNGRTRQELGVSTIDRIVSRKPEAAEAGLPQVRNASRYKTKRSRDRRGTSLRPILSGVFCRSSKWAGVRLCGKGRRGRTIALRSNKSRPRSFRLGNTPHSNNGSTTRRSSREARAGSGHVARARKSCCRNGPALRCLATPAGAGPDQIRYIRRRPQ